MLQIDLTGIIRSRVSGWKGKLIPGFLLRRLEKLIRQDRLNELLRITYPATGSKFSKAIYDTLGITLDVNGIENIPSVGRFIFASNHPLGGLDGMALIDYFSQRYGGELMFVVNDLLMAVKPLAPVFLPINKHGHQSRQSLAAIDRVMKGDDPVLIFPAGLCSRQRQAGGEVADLEWRKMFINRAISFKRDIVPVYFDGTNSDRFYSVARRRESMGLKFNFEMALLPSEVFKAEGKTFRINCGTPLPWQSLSGGQEAEAEAQAVRRMVYDLKNELETINKTLS